MTFAAMAFVANAAPRTPQEAIALAQSFVRRTQVFHAVHQSQLTLSTDNTAKVRARGEGMESQSYYIVNLDDNNGYVIVSGDDRFNDILGYSDQGHVDNESDMPDALKYWLASLSSEMDYAKANGYKAGEVTADSYAESVEPLLTSKWDQGSPYNKLIPNYATGCVATGIAQVMYYWKYPVHGIGSHTNGNNTAYSADFENTTYDWNNMKDVYGGKYDTQAQVDAVSTLMYHLGVSTDMIWRSLQEGSATGNIYAAHALITFFGYNKYLHAEDRDCFSLGAWKALILDQLRNGRPVPFSGHCDAERTAGHFFVLDGYDAETGLFHINWGWGGKCDGYYELSSLTPGTGGIGAGMGSYNYYQQIYVNVQPEDMGEYIAHFDAQTIKPLNMRTSKSMLTIVTNVLSNNALNFTGTYGMAIYNTDGTLYGYVKSNSGVPAGFHPGTSFRDEQYFEFNLSDIPDGDYIICLAAKHNSYPDKVFPFRANYGQCTYYAMNVAGENVSFTEQKSDYSISDAAAPVINGKADNNMLYQNVSSMFTITVRNSGTTEFYDEVGVCIKKSRDSKAQYITVPCNLQPGEEKTLTIPGKVLREPGSYSLYTCYGDNGSYSVLANSISVTVSDEANAIGYVENGDAEAPVFTLTGVRVDGRESLKKGIYISNGKKIIK